MKKMKLWSMLMLMVMALPMMVACSSDDDDDSPVDVSKAIGTWVCIKSTDNVQGKTYTDLFVGESVRINSNNTYASTSRNFGTSGTYSVNGNKITVHTNNAETYVITVSFSGNKMTWKGSGEDVKFTYVFEKEDTWHGTAPY